MLLQNKTRRSILERLVREPHYPMQLADLIGVSQQAIVKHLKELERGNLVEKMKVPSEKGGPHEPSSGCEAFSLRVDLGPDLSKLNGENFLPEDLYDLVPDCQEELKPLLKW